LLHDSPPQDCLSLNDSKYNLEWQIFQCSNQAVKYCLKVLKVFETEDGAGAGIKFIFIIKVT